MFCLYTGNLSAEIFYIDIDKIINQTKVGKYINKEFKDLNKINSIYIEIANDKEILNDYVKKLKEFKLIYFKNSKKRCDCLFEKN